MRTMLKTVVTGRRYQGDLPRSQYYTSKIKDKYLVGIVFYHVCNKNTKRVSGTYVVCGETGTYRLIPF